MPELLRWCLQLLEYAPRVLTGPPGTEATDTQTADDGVVGERRRPWDD